jgi:hypothetical protein
MSGAFTDGSPMVFRGHGVPEKLRSHKKQLLIGRHSFAT